MAEEDSDIPEWVALVKRLCREALNEKEESS